MKKEMKKETTMQDTAPDKSPSSSDKHSLRQLARMLYLRGALPVPTEDACQEYIASHQREGS